MSQALDDLISDFELLGDCGERYRYVIELGRALPAMEDGLKTSATKVSGCASQVWIYARPTDEGHLALQGDSDALIVKGLIAVTFKLLEPLTLPEIVSFDAQTAFARLGFKDNLT